jgi:hypothetical protein
VALFNDIAPYLQTDIRVNTRQDIIKHDTESSGKIILRISDAEIR